MSAVPSEVKERIAKSAHAYQTLAFVQQLFNLMNAVYTVEHWEGEDWDQFTAALLELDGYVGGPLTDPRGHALFPSCRRGWYARAYDGLVAEVWLFGTDAAWVMVGADGRVLVHGQGQAAYALHATREAAAAKALESAEEELRRAQAAVDALRRARD